jgi:hypothetical protein
MIPHNFCIFVITSPSKRIWLFLWRHLNSLHPSMICIKFDWNWPAVLEKEDFLKFLVYFYSFAIISSWNKGIALHLRNCGSPSLKDDLCQLWLQLVQHFRRRSWKCKSLTDRQTDDRWAILKARLGEQKKNEEKFSHCTELIKCSKACPIIFLISVWCTHMAIGISHKSTERQLVH